jgi:hypothetical protein
VILFAVIIILIFILVILLVFLAEYIFAIWLHTTMHAWLFAWLFASVFCLRQYHVQMPARVMLLRSFRLIILIHLLHSPTKSTTYSVTGSLHYDAVYQTPALSISPKFLLLCYLGNER